MTAQFSPPQADVVLRDVHIPPSPPWWPPAPGWWILLCAVCLALVVAFLLYRRWRRAHAQRQRILDELHALASRHDDDVAYASSLHQLLRRAARRYAADAHQRQGEGWRDVLARVPVDNATLDKLMTLDARMYQPRADFDREGVQAAAHRWLQMALRYEKAVAGSAEHA